MRIMKMITNLRSFDFLMNSPCQYQSKCRIKSMGNINQGVLQDLVIMKRKKELSAVSILSVWNDNIVKLMGWLRAWFYWSSSLHRFWDWNLIVSPLSSGFSSEGFSDWKKLPFCHNSSVLFRRINIKNTKDPSSNIVIYYKT